MIRATPFLAAALLVFGCNSGSVSPAPTGSPNSSTPPSPVVTPTPPAVTQVGSAAQAAAVVFASQGIGRMEPQQPDLIGQSAWYSAYQEQGGYGVQITVGAGDCQSGCIEHHVWTYHVDPDATVSLVSDEGDDIALPTATGTADPISLQIALTAGPTCPVVRNPPDPACAPRPVANAEINAYDISGNLAATGTSGVDGLATAQLPAGAYFVVATAVEGLMGQPEPLAFAAVGGDAVMLTFTYDTGIR